MLMFARIAEQLRQVEQELCSIQLSMDGSSARACTDKQATQETGKQLEQAILDLREYTAKLSIVNETYSQLHEDRPLDSVIELAVNLVWQKAPISYAALILGEAELGPYHYYGMKGIQESWRYVKKECNFSLSGVLARALLQRLDPNEPDYLYIPDIEVYGRPLPDEFPWMPRRGSVLLIPLRSDSLAKGALVLGHTQTYQFDDSLLRDEYVDIASSIASAIRNAQMRQEMAKNVEQLVNVQLLTREITHAQQYQDITAILTQKIPEVIGKVDVQVLMQHPAWGNDSDKIAKSQPTSNNSDDTTPQHSDRAERTALSELLPYGTLASTLPVDSPQNASSNLSASQDPLDAVQPEVRQLFQWTMEAAEPVFYDIEHLSNNPEHPYYSDSGRGLIVPIIGHSCTYGVIHVLSLSPLRRFDESDMVVLRTIANSAATAISSVELIQAREQAEVDAIYELICRLETPHQDSPSHSQRVVHNAMLLAQHMGLAPAECRLIRDGAALHHLALLTQNTPQERSHPHSNSYSCPPIETHILQTLRVNPAVSRMLAVVNTLHERQHPFTSEVNGLAAAGSHRLYQQLNAQNYAEQANSESQNSYVDGSYAQRPDKDLFANFSISQLGACVIHIVDAVDCIYVDAINHNRHAPTEVQTYLDAYSTTYITDEMVATVKELLGKGLLTLPAEALGYPVTTSVSM